MSLIVFDLGGSAVKYGLYEDGNLSHQNQFPTPSSWELMQDELLNVVQTLKQENTQGIAMSVPGSVDQKEGVIGGVSAIEYIHNFKFVDALETHLSLPVSIENDANCAALAELHSGVAKDNKDVLFVVVGTGIGGAVIQNGELLKGRNTFAGEFGCMILDGKTSFSLLATAVHMAERYCDRVNVPWGTYDGQEVFKKADDNDPIAQDEVNKFYDYLTLGLYNLQFTTDPECIVIGGGVTAHPPLIDELNRRMATLLLEAGLESVQFEIKAAHYQNDANLMGAVASFLKQKGENS